MKGDHSGNQEQPPGPPVIMAPLCPQHRKAVESILQATRIFREEEITVAMEVLDSYLSRPGQDYTAVGAFTPDGELLGFFVIGPTPCTRQNWDLYWIAVSPKIQRRGVGTALLEEAEGRLTRSGARQVIIETSSRPRYRSTRHFYQRRGYREVARIPDFYDDGDDKVVYAKTLIA